MLKKLVQFEGAAALLASAAIYATFGVLIREISKIMGDETQTFVRFALAAVVIAIINMIVRKKMRVSRTVLLKTVALGFIFAAVVVLFTISVMNTKLANSVFLLYAGSILSSFLIGTFILKEKVTTTKIVAIGIAAAGLSMYGGAFLAISAGVVAGFLSGIFDGMANAIRKTLKSVDRNTVVMYHYGFGALFALGLVLVTGGFELSSLTTMPLIALGAFVILMLFLSNLLLFGFQHFDVNVGTVILATELFFASLLGYLIFRETPTVQELAGGVLIFVASIVASVDFKQLLGFSKRRSLTN